MSDVGITLADGNLEIGDGDLYCNITIGVSIFAVQPANAGKYKQILNQSLHSLGAINRVVDVFVSRFVEFPFVALCQELCIGGNHAQRLLQIMRSDVSKLLQFAIGASKFLDFFC